MNENWHEDEEEATEGETRSVAVTCASLAAFLIATIAVVILLLTKFL